MRQFRIVLFTILTVIAVIIIVGISILNQLPIRYGYRFVYYRNIVMAKLYNDPAKAAQVLVSSATQLMQHATEVKNSDPTLSDILLARAENQVTLSIPYIKEIAPNIHVDFYNEIFSQLKKQEDIIKEFPHSDMLTIAENNERTIREYMYEFSFK